jgi:hypothetical protein
MGIFNSLPDVIRLNRDRVFLISMGIVLFFLLLNRAEFYFGSKTAQGEVTGFHRNYSNKGYVSYTPIVRFAAGKEFYEVETIKNMEAYVGDKYEMRYRPESPDRAVINNFYGFWFYPILFCLIPFMLLSAGVYSFIERYEVFCIRLRKQVEGQSIPSFSFSKELSDGSSDAISQ